MTDIKSDFGEHVFTLPKLGQYLCESEITWADGTKKRVQWMETRPYPQQTPLELAQAYAAGVRARKPWMNVRRVEK